MTLPEHPAYTTKLGSAWCADSLVWLTTLDDGAVDLESGDLLVIHAMKMRKVYWAEYKRLLEWTER